VSITVTRDACLTLSCGTKSKLLGLYIFYPIMRQKRVTMVCFLVVRSECRRPDDPVVVPPPAVSMPPDDGR
jgi:hypothetical protein